MDAVAHTKALVAFESTSNLSNVAISDYLDDLLQGLGAEVERVSYQDQNGVEKSNVIARLGTGTGGLAYFGHSDVVPAAGWSIEAHGPWTAFESDGKLFGRGTCDMKGSVACMLEAAARMRHTQLAAPLYITVTADEEVGYHGAKAVVKESRLYREMVANQPRVIIGEPTKLQVVYAHKGVCGFTAIAHGRAAHSSTRDGVNANLAMIPFLVEMKAIHDLVESDETWHNTEFDPPTLTWNIGINDHTAAVNITPPQSVCTVYFRPMPGQDVQPLLDRVRQSADENGLELSIHRHGKPKNSSPDGDFLQQALQLAECAEPKTVSYGTDGGEFHELEHKIVLGPGAIAQAHTSDEWVEVTQLQRGADLFEEFARKFCV